MSFNTTAAEQERQLQQDFRQKLKLERGMRVDLTRELLELNRQFVTQYTRTGRVLNVLEFHTDFVALFKRHYRRTKRVFGNQIRRNLAEQKSCRETKQLQEDIETAQNLYIAQESNSRSQATLITVDRQLRQSVVFAEQQIIEEQQEEEIPLFFLLGVPTAAVAAIAGNKFKSLIPAKSSFIASLAIQDGAEEMKLIEAEIMEQRGAIQNSNKQWQALLDERTRLSHASADGQVVGLRENFIVQGQSLSRPGDLSHGATMDNIANCRCSSLVIIP